MTTTCRSPPWCSGGRPPTPPGGRGRWRSPRTGTTARATSSASWRPATPEAYRAFAEGYYETTLDLAAIRHVWDLRPLTEDILKTLNPHLPLARAASVLARIGYPVGVTT